MVGDMLRLGYEQPEIRELDTQAVVTGLIGAAADQAWITWLAMIGDGRVADDLALLMAIRHLVAEGWGDANVLAPYLQLSQSEAADVVRRLFTLRINRKPLVRSVAGEPVESRDTAVHLGFSARRELERLG